MLINKKRGTNTIWEHTFVCLSYMDQLKIPTTDFEKDALLKSGLREQTIQFSSINIDADEFKTIIFDTFPKLLDGGGYMFYKCLPNCCVLEPLSESVLPFVKVLKERVGTTKRTYIKPMQKDLSEVYCLPKVVCVNFLRVFCSQCRNVLIVILKYLSGNYSEAY